MIDDGFKIEFLQMQTSYFSPHWTVYLQPKPAQMYFDNSTPMILSYACRERDLLGAKVRTLMSDLV